MAFFYKASPTWRWVVAKSKESRRFFITFGAVCVVVPWTAATLTRNSTNPMSEEELERRKQQLRGGRMDGEVMARVNKERLGQLLTEIQNKEDTEDRYKAALKGETLTGTPGARVRGGGGTSMPSLPDKEKGNVGGA